MSTASESSGRWRKRKRKTMGCRGKLSVHDPVEVRSVEDGFLGSWHSGILIACGRQNSSVKYDDILADDGITQLVELLPGVDCEAKLKKGTCRGRIRPLPPLLRVVKSGLPYGLCVDVRYLDAWWEGVIFDHEDGSKERRIFFPDLGDELKADIDDLRITQDWDEDSGNWRQRGTWLFLELIKKYEQDQFLPVSAKQIWYDFREKEGFEKIKEWASTAERSLWEELLLEVYNDNLEIAVSHFFRDSGLEGGKEQEAPLQLEYSKSTVEPNFSPVLDLTDSLHLVPVKTLESPMNINLRTLGDKPSILPLDLSVSPSSADDSEAVLSSESSEINGKYTVSKNRRSQKWQSANLEIVHDAEFCPDAMAQYVRMGNKRGHPTLWEKIRKHLKYLGWNIEYKRDYRNNSRLCYTSPLGKAYYSLRQICLELSESTTETLSPAFQRGQRSLPTLPDDYICSLITQPEPAQNQDQTSGTKLIVSSHSDGLLVEAECCPQAVIDWYECGQRNDDKDKISTEEKRNMILKARKHLSALGWRFQYKNKKMKRELNYISPSGKTYNSLRVACKDCINGQVTKCNAYTDKQAERLPRAQNSRLPKLRREEISGASSGGRDKMKGSHPTRILRSSKRVQQALNPSSSYHGARTVLSWLIDHNVVLPRTKVYYRGRKDQRPMKVGRITRNGIKCNCCMKVYTLSGFEAHAGSSRHKPSACIFLEDGRSLLDCQLQIKNGNKMKKTADPCQGLEDSFHQGENDHICSVCHYGGDLILCDRCPSSFHKGCLGLKVVPGGDWFCPSCCCRICGLSKFKEDAEHSMCSKVISCTQCERKYHVGCVENRGNMSERYLETSWFCSIKCEEISLGLYKLLGRPIPVGVNNLTWTILKFMRSGVDGPDASDCDEMIENYSKLNVALGVMHECFETVKEPYTGRDLVEDVIFSRWSELNRLNFRGFYTVLLERNDELITAATVRVHGAKVAEVPLVGTRFQYRRLGMCRILMNELEKMLMKLGVERLVLPAVPSVLNTWTTKFRFSKMMNSERLQFVDYTFLDFQETVMCQKHLVNIPSVDSRQSMVHNHCDFAASQPSLCNNECGQRDNIDFDGSSSTSDVLQAEQIDESGIVDQGLKGSFLRIEASFTKSGNKLSRARYKQKANVLNHHGPSRSEGLLKV
ncbi:hypothetical protein HS088_TW07G00067 [Tripterygium wilfordii]|uniref:PHD-type domain-containing protein n=1 Tax=Tripterygium wilfordii TaxID=458696 RepID=A0A7J7DDP1_TRIWF|nr:hypothetical protein HS088_TW07G00067 [Tripterygium wilfordii]